MEAMEQTIEKACKDHVVPGVVLYCKNASGSFEYKNAFGALSVAEDAPQEPLGLDSVFLIASCTKLMTSISALQCVERGLVQLDEDVARHLPELAALEILTGFDDEGKAKMAKRQNAITLRLLLTHSTGLGYDAMSPQLAKYRASRGEQISTGSTLLERFTAPLLFEPGTSWQYGPSIDWAGRLVERLTDMTLEEYMRENLWRPLGIKDMTFFPSKNADMKARLSGMTLRDSQSGKAVDFTGPTLNTGVTDCLGGQGCYATMPEYIKILHSLLVDDGKLLEKETTKVMFEPQLTADAKGFMNSLRDRPEVWKLFVGHFPRHVDLDWGLAGILTVAKDEGWREDRTLIWSGLPNLFWFIDRKTGLCGIFATQVLPPGDLPTDELITLFEKTMYKQVTTAKM